MRVLIIDDEAKLRLIVRKMLEAAGYEVGEAENGRAGLQAFQEKAADIVLTDIIMPEKEGIETIVELRKLSQKSLRIVAMSGGGRAKNVDFLKIAQSLGADATLAKPFRKEDLIACIEGRSPDDKG